MYEFEDDSNEEVGFSCVFRFGFLVEFALCSPLGGHRRGKGLEVRKSSEIVLSPNQGNGRGEHWES